MSVEEELAFGLENLGLPREEIKKRIDETLNLVNIKELRDRSPSELSSGQQQKVAIAAVLAMNPEILVLDEPTSMIDPKSALDITQFLNKLNKERGVTVIVAEHRLENLVSFADKIVVINNGSIVQAGSPREIFASNNLLDIGVAIPRIIQLANRLKKAGIKIDNLPLTVEEEFSVLRRIL